MKQERRPTFLITRFIMKRIGKVHHQDYINDGPYKQIKKVKKPILFIYSQEDVFVPPEDAKIVMDNCASEHKKIALFPTGRHSHVRINHQEEYDKAIIDFLKQELKRCELLGIKYIVLHPGSAVTHTKEEALQNIIDALNEVIDENQQPKDKHLVAERDENRKC